MSRPMSPTTFHATPEGAILRDCAEAIVCVDAARRVVQLNIAAEVLLGFGAEAVLGCRVASILPESIASLAPMPRSSGDRDAHLSSITGRVGPNAEEVAATVFEVVTGADRVAAIVLTPLPKLLAAACSRGRPSCCARRRLQLVAAGVRSAGTSG